MGHEDGRRLWVNPYEHGVSRPVSMNANHRRVNDAAKKYISDKAHNGVLSETHRSLSELR